jgi:hypothetical protein
VSSEPRLRIIRSANSAWRPPPDGVVVPLLVRNVVADHEPKERIIRASSLDRVIIRIRGSPTPSVEETYRSRLGILATSVVPRISRADLTDFMPGQIGEDTYLRQAPAVMS